jgi:hypothetical protein
LRLQQERAPVRTIRGDTLPEQGFYFPAQVIVVSTRLREKRAPLSRLTLPSRMEELFDLAQTFGSHRIFSDVALKDTPLITSEQPAFGRYRDSGQTGFPHPQALVNQRHVSAVNHTPVCGRIFCGAALMASVTV